ncbi:MAG: hypothetical protein WD535_01000 [Thermaerobacterales bacterium]
MNETALPKAADSAPRGIRRIVSAPVLLWLSAGIPVLIHIITAIRNVLAGHHQVLPAFQSFEGGLTDALSVYVTLFFKPETAETSYRLFALWLLVILGLAIFDALRAGDRLPSGVASFIGYFFAGVILLALVTPAVWFLFGSWGPAAVEFAPPLIFGVIAVLLIRDSN